MRLAPTVSRRTGGNRACCYRRGTDSAGPNPLPRSRWTVQLVEGVVVGPGESLPPAAATPTATPAASTRPPTTAAPVGIAPSAGTPAAPAVLPVSTATTVPDAAAVETQAPLSARAYPSAHTQTASRSTALAGQEDCAAASVGVMDIAAAAAKAKILMVPSVQFPSGRTSSRSAVYQCREC